MKLIKLIIVVLMLGLGACATQKPIESSYPPKSTSETYPDVHERNIQPFVDEPPTATAADYSAPNAITPNSSGTESTGPKVNQ